MSPRRGGSAGAANLPQPSELPAVNLLVRLIAPDGVTDAIGLPSRIEDIDTSTPGRPASIRVAAPAYTGDLLDPRQEGWVLTWVSDRGRWELPVTRADATGPGPRSWWLTPTGPIRRNQRRSFYRVECSVALEVDVLVDPFPMVNGVTLDVSEGGVRGLLPVTELDPGTPVAARLGLDDVSGTFEGIVRRSTRTTGAALAAGWNLEIAIAFDDPESHGDVLRQALVQMQLRARRLAMRDS